MTRADAHRRPRLIEALLWVVVLLAGAVVLLPGAVDWLQGRREKQEAENMARESEQAVKEQSRTNRWFLQDPTAPEKVAERQLLESRNSYREPTEASSNSSNDGDGVAEVGMEFPPAGPGSESSAETTPPASIPRSASSNSTEGRVEPATNYPLD
ncbi:MAG: hypothetical protein DWQ01_18855 [Planctomycetota bacterium]|nr:MAG: hypothetical protein DWQ01_18855 [Planctomycetota bacterium]